jgi:hypothetical protein
MIEMLNSEKLEYKVGLRLISNALKGVIIKIINIKSGEKSGNYIIIEWEKPNLIGVMALDLKQKTSIVQYNELMLDEAFSEGIIKIDKQYYRNQKLEELGI